MLLRERFLFRSQSQGVEVRGFDVKKKYFLALMSKSGFTEMH